MHLCKVCFKPIKHESIFELLYPKPTLCQSCFRKTKVLDAMLLFHHLNIWFLFDYDSTIRQWLFQYKGLYDVELQSVFLERFIHLIKLKFPSYLFIPAPSSSEDDALRGFAHLPAMLDYFKLPWLPLMHKKSNFKQSELSLEERQQVKSKLEITKGYLVRHRRIVLVDDVFTSGSTLLAMRDLILPYQPQVVKGLVIAKNQKNSFWK